MRECQQLWSAACSHSRPTRPDCTSSALGAFTCPVFAACLWRLSACLPVLSVWLAGCLAGWLACLPAFLPAEHIYVGMQLLSSLLLLGGGPFLSTYGPQLMSACTAYVGEVVERGLLLMLPPVDLLMVAAPQQAAPLVLPFMQVGGWVGGGVGQEGAAAGLNCAAVERVGGPEGSEWVVGVVCSAGTLPVLPWSLLVCAIAGVWYPGGQWPVQQRGRPVLSG